MTTDPSPALPSPALAFCRSLFKHRGALAAASVLLLVALAAVFADWMAPYDPIQQYREQMLTPPAWADGGSASHPLGTDELGRDILSRLLHGARISLLIGVLSVALALLPGMALGLLAAFYPRRLGVFIMRAIDVMMALPSLLLAICIITMLGPGLANTMIAIAIGALPSYTRLTRGAAMTELGKDYVTASRVAGAGPLHLMVGVVLPNCMAPLIVNATMGFSSAILEAAALGFLGLGVQAPLPEWGTMLSSARDYMVRAPWVVTMPGLTILLAVLSINLLGDGLRDALDPKLKQAA
jgi:dipeptide transport system permease protein